MVDCRCFRAHAQWRGVVQSCPHPLEPNMHQCILCIWKDGSWAFWVLSPRDSTSVRLEDVNVEEATHGKQLYFSPLCQCTTDAVSNWTILGWWHFRYQLLYLLHNNWVRKSWNSTHKSHLHYMQTSTIDTYITCHLTNQQSAVQLTTCLELDNGF